MAREPWRITEQTEFLGQDMDSEPDQIAKGYVRRLVDFEPEGGAIRERDPLDKYFITWPEYYTAPVVGLARGRFFDDIYPTVVFLVDSAGHLYYLESAQAPGAYNAHGLQRFWTNPTYIEAVQFIHKVVLTDGNAMVAGWAEDGAVKAELLQPRPHPGVPRFTDNWDSGSHYSEVTDWVTGREYAGVCAVRYVLTYVWEDEVEGPPGPISEPYTLPAYQWDTWYNVPIELSLPTVPTLDPAPKSFRIYRTYSLTMGGVGDIGWQGPYALTDVPVSLDEWVDSFTIPQEAGAGLPPVVLSSIPAGKHLDVAPESKRLLIGNIKETLNQRPEPGEVPWNRFGDPTEIDNDVLFTHRLAIDVSVTTESVACRESITLRLQNTNQNQHEATSAVGAYVPIADLTTLWSESSKHLLYFAMTDLDGITVLPQHVAWGSSSYLEIVVQLPEISPGISRRLYLYYGSEGAWYANRTKMGLYLGVRRIARSGEMWRMNGGLWPSRFADEDRPACSASGVEHAYIDLSSGGPHALDATDVRDAEVTASTNISVANRLNKVRRTLTFDRDAEDTYWVYTTDGGVQIADMAVGSCCFWLFDADTEIEEALTHELFSIYDPAGGGAHRIRVTVELPGGATMLRFGVGIDSPPAALSTIDVLPAEELFLTVDWSSKNETVVLRIWRPGNSPFTGTGYTATDAAAFSNMANVEARFLWRTNTSPDPFNMRIGDIMMTHARLTYQEELWEANMLPYGAVAVVDPEPEEIGVPEHYPNRGRYCESSDLKSWAPLAYRDIGSEDHPINLVAVFEQNVGWCKPDGIYPMYLGSGGQLEFTDEGVLSETVFWNPQTLAADKRGYAGCSAPGAGVSTPDGVWMFSGNSIIRWDGRKIWDHTDGMRSQFVTSQAWRTETPVLFFWEPVRQNLMIAWKDAGAWRIAGIRKTFVKGNKVWGWFEHQGYEPAVVSRSPGVVQGDLLLCDGTTVYFFNQNLQTGTYATISPWVQLPDLRLVKGNARGFGVSFSGAETVAASVFLNGQAVHSYTSIVSDKQYPVRRANARKFGLKLYGTGT